GIDAGVGGGEASGEFRTVGLGGEDGVDGSVAIPSVVDRFVHQGDVGVPDSGVVVVDRDVVHDADDVDVRQASEGLAQPCHARSQGNRLDAGGHDDHGHAVAGVRGGTDQESVPGVRRVELADHQAVAELVLHAVTAAAAVS